MTGRVGSAEVAFALARGPNRVGSHPASQVCLAHDGVSRRHALLLLEPDRVEVVDQGSKNGTFVNGRRVRSAEVQLGDRIGFGPVELALAEADADDLRLAVDIAAAGARAPRGDTPTAGPPGAEPVTRWLRLVRRFVEQLAAAPAGGAAPALAALVEELGAVGACLAEITAEDGMVVLAGCGDLAATRLESALPLPSRLPARGRFRSEAEETALVLPGAERTLALIVAGDFADRVAARPLLATLLTLWDQLNPRALHPFEEVSAGPPAGLTFPPGYVPGTSAVMTALHGQLRSLAAGDLPLLIEGETGVGKEMVARTLHLSSPRGDGPFVAINCAAIPADLLEAELFGIRRGVATGVEGRPGRFQQAAGGTLFLDEIGEMPPAFQVKLLRALQEKSVTLVGGAQQAIDVRVLAATNADLLARLEAGAFRRDLFYRIAGFVLRVPALRERAADVPLLVEAMLRAFSRELGKPLRGMTVAALRILTRYPWPGNVRELEHELRRLVSLCPAGQVIRAGAISEHIRRAVAGADPTAAREPGAETSPAPADPGAAASDLPTLQLGELEARAVREALRRAGGNRAEAARLLGISRYALLRRLRHLRG